PGARTGRVRVSKGSSLPWPARRHGGETTSFVYARRSGIGVILGPGFDSPRLHCEKQVGKVVEGGGGRWRLHRSNLPQPPPTSTNLLLVKRWLWFGYSRTAARAPPGRPRAGRWG